jgi:Zn-dependent protease with chaperone function
VALVDSSRSLAFRAVLALLLMVGFYAFAVGISAALLWIPYAEIVYLKRIDPKIAAVCVGAAGTILWALVPRRDRFEPPGPRLTAADAPQLFRAIEEVARATNQPRPEDVYLLNEVNAWVTHRGGVMGFGSRRVMGVGLPLMAGLTNQELRAVIAHEFGHYSSGDVALGPWIYKTRAAIGRAVAGVRQTFLESAFIWYGRLFMRVTMAVSRRQEFAADATAARVCGADPVMSALRKVATLAPAYSSYFRSEVLAVLRAGFLPPIAEGFERYMANPDVARALTDLAHAPTTGDHTEEFDSHPPLTERLAALASPSEPPAGTPQGAVAALLNNPEAHARALLEYTFGREPVQQLRIIQWEDVGRTVYAEMWHATARRYTPWLGTMTAGTMPVGKRVFIARGTELVEKGEGNINGDELVARTMHVLTAGLGSVLLRAGWSIETAPGRALEVVKGSDRFNPGDAVQRLAAGEWTGDQWTVRCQQLGIAGQPLALKPDGPAAAAASIEIPVA